MNNSAVRQLNGFTKHTILIPATNLIEKQESNRWKL